MDIIDFTDKFQKIEIEYDFFAEIDSKGLLYWDIVRYDVFNLLYHKVCDTKFLKIENNPKLKLNKLITLFNNLLSFISFKIRISSSYKYICFTTSRNKDDNKKNIDLISDDILRSIHLSSLVIESFCKNTKDNRYKSVFDFGLLLATYKWRLKHKLCKNIPNTYNVTEVLKHEFNIDIDLNNGIDALIIKYKISNEYYLRLFQKIKPKAIFMVQNGIQKGLFVAAHQLNIRVIELQHGFIGYVHPAYSYPEIIRPENLNTVPDTFFSFSNFWTSNLNYPVKNIIPMGNDFYANRTVNESKEYDLTFIFANIYTNDLLQFINGLLQNGYKGKLCIKLHPNQFDEFSTITSLYSSYSNIEVISSQRSMGEVLSISKAIFAVQSTAVYEALHCKVKVYLYKIKNYLTHQDVIDNPNVYLVDKVADIIEFEKYSFIESEESTMFEPFKESLFNEFIQNL